MEKKGVATVERVQKQEHPTEVFGVCELVKVGKFFVTTRLCGLHRQVRLDD